MVTKPGAIDTTIAFVRRFTTRPETHMPRTSTTRSETTGARTYATKNDLPEATRLQAAALLNQRLA